MTEAAIQQKQSTSGDSLGKLERVMRIVGTHGLAVLVAVVLLGYFLWKDFHTTSKVLDAIQSTSSAVQDNTAAMREIAAELRDLTSK